MEENDAFRRIDPEELGKRLFPIFADTSLRLAILFGSRAKREGALEERH